MYTLASRGHTAQTLTDVTRILYQYIIYYKSSYIHVSTLNSITQLTTQCHSNQTMTVLFGQY